ncbi:MAG: twin-arginine translocation signal domain-containing protein, partial [Chitinophagaceae bacterium]
MKNNRRDFIKKSATLASAMSMGGFGSAIASAPNINTKGSTKESMLTNAKDAGMVMSEAYFAGMDERRIAFMKQLDVFGAVGGIN